MDTKKTLHKHIKERLNETKWQSNGGVFKAEETTEDEGIGFLSAWLTTNRLANAVLVHNDTAKSQNEGTENKRRT